MQPLSSQVGTAPTESLSVIQSHKQLGKRKRSQKKKKKRYPKQTNNTNDETADVIQIPQNSQRSQRREMQRLKGFPMKATLKTEVISFQICSLVHYFQTTPLHLFHLIDQLFLSTASLREVITPCLHFPCLLPWEQYQLQIQIYDLAKGRELKKADKE